MGRPEVCLADGEHARRTGAGAVHRIGTRTGTGTVQSLSMGPGRRAFPLGQGGAFAQDRGKTPDHQAGPGQCVGPSREARPQDREGPCVWDRTERPTRRDSAGPLR
ncbi:hypothetical protein LNKW23_39240 [Paralimibaculum aggregatum]|uniref:Uncharacterized protein n=1 Tax=Paralimibaculum aggregatum TaxID=3036245 RepID=A0ABQ6LNF9_9RHOB|nr:hypothetical protein LNKW23_39240 [Limibaculum sp. NKW23]